MAYVKQATWIDDGPGPVVIPRAAIVKNAAGPRGRIHSSHAAGCHWKRRGMGAQPDSVCYDPTRPSWLPYWMDDFQEAACWDNQVLFGTIPGATVVQGAPPAGSAPGTPGSTTIYTMDQTTINNLSASCTSGGGTWDTVNNVCKPNTLMSMLPWIVGGIAAVVVLPALVAGGRR